MRVYTVYLYIMLIYLESTSDQHHIRAHRDLICKNLRFEGPFLATLTSKGVISEVQSQEIAAIPHKARHRRSQTLLDMIEKGGCPERTGIFVEVLESTSQQHIAQVVREGGRSVFLSTQYFGISILYSFRRSPVLLNTLYIYMPFRVSKLSVHTCICICYFN